MAWSTFWLLVGLIMGIPTIITPMYLWLTQPRLRIQLANYLSPDGIGRLVVMSVTNEPRIRPRRRLGGREAAMCVVSVRVRGPLNNPSYDGSGVYELPVHRVGSTDSPLGIGLSWKVPSVSGPLAPYQMALVPVVYRRENETTPKFLGVLADELRVYDGTLGEYHLCFTVSSGQKWLKPERYCFKLTVLENIRDALTINPIKRCTNDGKT